jgi:ribosomal protein S18 acetylase RimI-like enzyme
MPGFTHRGSPGKGVHPDFRRRGIGRRLIEAAISLTKEGGLERLDLEVFASNSKAIALYESVGFAVEGTIRCGRKLDGKCEDLLTMGMFL